MSKPHLETGSHTPGPWKLGDRVGNSIEIDAPHGDPTIGHKSWSGLATVYGCDDYPRAGTLAMDANARLIAAAPELLEALQMAVENDVFDYHGGDAAQGRICDKCKAADAARAAIAKATGAV